MGNETLLGWRHFATRGARMMGGDRTALEGTWRDEHLFELRQTYELSGPIR